MQKEIPADLARHLSDRILALRPERADPSGHIPLPSRDAVVRIVETLRSVLFPGYFGTLELHRESTWFHVGAALHESAVQLERQIVRALQFVCDNDDCADRARRATHEFVEGLDEMQRVLLTDVHAAFDGDPAATSQEETILCYPGILAITNYRIAHALSNLGVPVIPRMITEHAHSTTGIDIHPGARIGERFFIDHGTGVVIGETSVIGRNVRVYQGVTLGARSFPLDSDGHPVKGIPRHPIVEDDVVIYAGATILGRITIGRGSAIGGNVWVTQSVPPGSFVSQSAARRDAFELGGGI